MLRKMSMFEPQLALALVLALASVTAAAQAPTSSETMPTAAATTGASASAPVSVPVAAPAPMASNASPQAVPPGTEVKVKTVDALTSATATTGQKFVVEVAADVVVDGQVVIPAGTRGTGTVIFARKKGVSGGPGALDVRIDSVESPNGSVRLKSNETNRGTDRRRSGTAAQLAFGILGALAVQGEDIALPVGSEMLAVVAAPRPTAAPATATASALAPATATATPAAAPAAAPATAAATATAPAPVESAAGANASTAAAVPAAPAASTETTKDHP